MKIKLGRELSQLKLGLQLLWCEPCRIWLHETCAECTNQQGTRNPGCHCLATSSLCSPRQDFLCFGLHNFSLISRIDIFLIAAFFQDNLRSTQKNMGQVESTSLCFTTGLVHLQKIATNSDITLPQSEKEACGSMFMTISSVQSCLLRHLMTFH